MGETRLDSGGCERLVALRFHTLDGMNDVDFAHQTDSRGDHNIHWPLVVMYLLLFAQKSILKVSGPRSCFHASHCPCYKLSW